MRRQNDWLIQHRVASKPNGSDDFFQGINVLGAGEVTDILEHQILGMPGTNDLHDIEEKRAARLICYTVLLPRLRKWLAREPAAKNVVRGHQFTDFLRTQVGIFVMNVRPSKKTDVLRESLLLPEVSLVNEAAMTIHLAGKYALSAIGTELGKRPMESSDTGKEIYELNCLHVGSLAAKVAQASLGLDFFNQPRQPQRRPQLPPRQSLRGR